MNRMDKLLDKVTSNKVRIGDVFILHGLARSHSFRQFLSTNYEIHIQLDGSHCIYSIPEGRYIMRYKEFHRTETNEKGDITGIFGIDELPLGELE